MWMAPGWMPEAQLLQAVSLERGNALKKVSARCSSRSLRSPKTLSYYPVTVYFFCFQLTCFVFIWWPLANMSPKCDWFKTAAKTMMLWNSRKKVNVHCALLRLISLTLGNKVGLRHIITHTRKHTHACTHTHTNLVLLGRSVCTK